MVKLTYERDKQAVDMVHMKNRWLHKHLDYYSKEYQQDTLRRQQLLNAWAVGQPWSDSTSSNNTNYYFVQFGQHIKMLDPAIMNSNFEILKMFLSTRSSKTVHNSEIRFTWQWR